jgi:ABC-type oligopeptide transport system substrate-binding subunit
MSMRHLTLCFLSIFFIFCTDASAEEPFGLAMHGKPKYGPEATHLDYANLNAPKGGTLRMAGLGTFDSVNPYAIKGKAAEGLNLVYDRLMARVWDEPFTMYPLIADKVTVPDDRSEMTVHVNPKARFHDGTPITADDVIFSFETLRDFGRPNMRRIYRLVKEAKKIDALTVHFAFGEGYDRETAMIVAMMPVLSKKWWSGKTFDAGTLETPLLNGPYKIVEIEPGRRVVYERVKDYWAKDLLTNAGHFNYDRIIYDYYRDDTVAFEAFKAHNIDLRREWDAGKWASGYDFPAAKDGRVVMDALPHGRPEKVRSFIFNTRRAPFDDIKVRQALNLLFDFNWVNKNIFHGQYKRINSYFPNSELAAPDAPPLPGPDVRANMRQANQLLNEAGWVVQNGKRVKNGKPFTFEIILSAPEDEKIALNFKKTLNAMGIDVGIRLLDSAQYIRRLNEYNYDMTLYYWLSTLSPGTEQVLYWSCEAAKQPARFNYAGVCDPQVDDLANKIAQARDRGELVTAVQTLDKRLLEGTYMIPLYYSGVDDVAYWKPLTRPETTPLYGMVMETWWMGP